MIAAATILFVYVTFANSMMPAIGFFEFGDAGDAGDSGKNPNDDTNDVKQNDCGGHHNRFCTKAF